MNIGYYYCSLDTFYNILSTKTIYLSDPLKMNDPYEIMWYLNLLKQEYDILKDAGMADQSELDRMKRQSGINFSAEELMKYINEKGQDNVYICCFSQHGDILSQWREYADKARGVSIGFDLNRFQAENIDVQKVKYSYSVDDEDDSQRDVRNVSENTRMLIDINQIDDVTEQKKMYLDELLRVLVEYKNPGYEEEDEIRLIYHERTQEEILAQHINENNDVKVKENLVREEHHFRIDRQRGKVVEYIALPFEADMIESIYIGPGASVSESDISRMCEVMLGIKKNNLPEIFKSSVTCR